MEGGDWRGGPPQGLLRTPYSLLPTVPGLPGSSSTQRRNFCPQKQAACVPKLPTRRSVLPLLPTLITTMGIFNRHFCEEQCSSVEILTWAAELEGFLVVFYFNFIHHISNGDDSQCLF